MQRVAKHRAPYDTLIDCSSLSGAPRARCGTHLKTASTRRSRGRQGFRKQLRQIQEEDGRRGGSKQSSLAAVPPVQVGAVGGGVDLAAGDDNGGGGVRNKRGS